jgi:hypothetical protein
VARLTKRDVEAMLATYDADPVQSLHVALGRVLDRPDATWPALVAATGLPDTERAALARADPAALDALARTLNELRTVPRPPP